MDKLKKHWGISSNKQLTLILLTFAVNGSTSGLLAKPMLDILGIYKENINSSLFYILYFVIISIIYFTILILTSKIFGQFTFFKKFAKKSLSPLGFGWFFK